MKKESKYLVTYLMGIPCGHPSNVFTLVNQKPHIQFFEKKKKKKKKNPRGTNKRKKPATLPSITERKEEKKFEKINNLSFFLTD